ncbi:immunoglobulin lambda-1 light chain-like [Oncorhynchus nerka]|uniref:immunoglobulin lambda-1 light chain-like n=1 Tax=Oncorhynchus nerka TaxID=8023 RepID=UPI0011320A84|nr:immunoglobulin lambda-1 light chain-like [Oncorhynchus nerka]
MSLGSVVILYSLYLMSVAGQKLDNKMTLIRKRGQPVIFSCQNIDQNCNYVYWYQKKEGEPFILILRIQSGYCTVYSDYNHPQKGEFSAMRQSKNCNLKIQSVTVSHSATYFCACWDSSTHNDCKCSCVSLKSDNRVQKPKVTVYQVSKPEPNRKTTLLCLARDMFPDLVKISWKMVDTNVRTMEVPKAEMEELVQREEGRTTSMIIIDKEKTYKNKYICSVEHKGGPQDVDIPTEEPTEAPPTTMAAPTTLHVTCEDPTEAPPSTKAAPTALQATNDSFQSTCSLNLASLVYTVMIVKSMVYCCALSLLLHNRNLGSRPSTSRPIH